MTPAPAVILTVEAEDCAGNAGQEAPTREGDIGFVMGRIHTSGQIPAANLSADIHFRVVGNTIRDVPENELELWYSAQDRFAVHVRPPGSTVWIGPVAPGQFIENQPFDSWASSLPELV